ncbi:MAG: glycosyltransferase family 2 protein [Sphingopyxis sp.]|uniref:glycosyltransferase family 2 protein n=1 Tax=Sphingopyxis sp. TaxID=1908224 RepID=UPI001A4D0550|nr:glycosyltransferase family 2 protein [Sphingopyxis sp.]MBL9068881.1 glycosyltransferase family 2 protein [Sphingopyxis sp.]
MKLIIQIPCFNEADTIGPTVADLPRHIPGIDVIEYLVIDDGSSDGTSEIAAACGVHHVLRNRRNMGLARSFRRGLDFALGAGADIIVNTDGDNQYCGADIEKLVEPILAGRADVVIGDRQTQSIVHFSRTKRLLQRFGSWVVRHFSSVDVPDAVSGFRAISRAAAMQVNIVSSFSYTIEMLIQVGRKAMAYESVPIRTNAKTRDSRLFSSAFRFIERSGSTALRMYAMYQPLRTFTLIGAAIALIGVIPMLRFLYFYLFVTGEGKIQSLVVGSALLTVGTITFVVGLMADLISHNRQLVEMTLERVKRIEHMMAAAKGADSADIPKEAAVSEEFHYGRRAEDKK